jgi:hypothetical protein
MGDKPLEKWWQMVVLSVYFVDIYEESGSP